MQGGRRGQGERWRGGAVEDRLDAAVLGLGQREGEGRGSRGGWLVSGVLLGVGGGRGRGSEAEQGAEASGGGLRGPKLMGGHCGYCVVKDTCKYIKQKWKEEEGHRGGHGVGWGGGADPSGEDSEREGDKERSEG